MTDLVGYSVAGTEDQNEPIQCDVPEVAVCLAIATDVEAGYCPIRVEPG
jgi:hypothetical protein